MNANGWIQIAKIIWITRDGEQLTAFREGLEYWQKGSRSSETIRVKGEYVPEFLDGIEVGDAIKAEILRILGAGK